MPEFPSGEPSGHFPAPVAPSEPVDWKTAVMDLIAARAELIRLELVEFRHQSARRAALLILAVLAGASAWILLLAGSIPLLADALGLPWPIVALLLGALHMILLGVFLTLARGKPGPAFPATLSEFQKDREWIENLNKTPKS